MGAGPWVPSLENCMYIHIIVHKYYCLNPREHRFSVYTCTEVSYIHMHLNIPSVLYTLYQLSPLSGLHIEFLKTELSIILLQYFPNCIPQQL